jgi:hypothetical protein
MTGETIPLKEHLEALRIAGRRFDDERDRRYKEVGEEREKALKIKETADMAALQLAREIQTYKDEKANELREQINSERGLYATNRDIEPIKSYIASQTGRGLGMNALFGWAIAVLMAVIAVAVYLK